MGSWSATHALILALAAVIGAAIFAMGAEMRRRAGARPSRRAARSERSEAALAVQPSLVLLWADDIAGEPDAPSAMHGGRDVEMAIAERTDVSRGRGFGRRLLEALEDWRAVSLKGGGSSTITDALQTLRSDGVPFDLRLISPEGRAIDAFGRTVGADVALWLHPPWTGPMGALENGPEAASREALSGLPFPIWRRGPDLSVIWRNAAYEALTGEGDGAREIESEADTLARDAWMRGQTERRQSRLTVAGERRTLEIVETPLGPYGLVGAAIDRSELDFERRRAARLKRAYESTLNELETGVAVFDPKRRLQYANAAFAQLWGLEPEDLPESIDHESLLDLLQNRRVLPAQTDYRVWRAKQMDGYGAPDAASEELWPLPDGRALQVRRRADASGGLLFLFDDVTRRLELEAAYHTVLRVQTATLDNLADGVAVFGSDGRLRLHNPAFRDALNLPHSLLREQPHFEVLLEALRAQVSDPEVWEQFRERITGLDDEHRNRLHGVEIRRLPNRVLSASATPLPDGATLLAFLDVSDAKLREAALEERNRALEAADRLKSQFVSHVSYQLRTPLNSIMGFSEILREGMFGPLNTRQTEYVDGVLTASHQLIGLIDDVIDLSLVESGQLELRFSPVDPVVLLKDAAARFEGRASSAEIAVEIRFDGDLGLIQADHDRIAQSLDNVIANALAFTPAGGRVTLGAVRDETEVRLWVSDTGRGIAQEDQSRVFDRFERRGGRGAGLGLALVRSFVELHGGRVVLRSIPNEGTTVVFHLPHDPETVERREATASYAPIGLAAQDGATEPAVATF